MNCWFSGQKVAGGKLKELLNIFDLLHNSIKESNNPGCCFQLAGFLKA